MQAGTQPAAAAGGAPPAPVESVADDNVEQVIAVDDDDTDADTESIRTSSTTSLSESISEYRRIHGRTYTQKAEYWGPNDARQNEGLELTHYWETLFFDDKLFLAPIGDSPQQVLDVGTGTGIWAIDFADEFPSSEVIGVDISPIQPGWVPPNCKFQIDDIEQPWTWSEDFFDYIHIRHLEASIADWPALYAQAFEHLKPGGYIEIKEFEVGHLSQAYGDDLPEDHIHNRTAKIMLQAAERLGKPLTQTRDHGIAKALKAAGFVDIVEKRWPIPIGSWPADPILKEVGQCNWEFIDQSFEGFCLFLLKEIMGWEYEEIVMFVAENRQALRDVKLQSFQYLHLVYARKPESTEEKTPASI
ncbi:Secondary metabolism regulator LAE1 [Colletotrichum orbiculare MAFF 240422]|uniref:Secondary metabolism regulator LAE1 n=1 Tax=Colletotrichum orbiculare (strain 104-T / ATCC 96160 / CBS 514.97 / LARS 414 / MAFF 240422) TaxID=1213857 RepID=A0A484FGC0_COLOR|nr:Secondary metabolism regulator LAE1 [Colletotrichum orbiculare MAFF 240422]